MSEKTTATTVRPLILGAGGLVGSAVSRLFEARFPHTVAATRTEIDILDRFRTEAEIVRLEPTVVINCAAEADVDRCEREPERALRFNAEAPHHLARACRESGVRLVHVSTDYVFGGDEERREAYDEADPPDPVNHYGVSKLRGEDLVLGELADVVVARVSLVFGDARPTFVDKMADRLGASDEEIPVVDGWITRPTPAIEIARAFEKIVLSDVTGLWHVTSGPSVTRLEFARQIARALGHDEQRLVPLDPDALDVPARRPAFSALSTRRFVERFEEEPVSWVERLAEQLGRRKDAGS